MAICECEYPASLRSLCLTEFRRSALDTMASEQETCRSGFLKKAKVCDNWCLPHRRATVHARSIRAWGISLATANL
jgi:hypothetical protein